MYIPWTRAGDFIASRDSFGVTKSEKNCFTCRTHSERCCAVLGELSLSQEERANSVNLLAIVINFIACFCV